MNRATAEKLAAIYRRLDMLLNDASALIGTIPDPEEQRRLRRPLGEVKQSVWVGLIRPVLREYPHLDPDRTAS